MGVRRRVLFSRGDLFVNRSPLPSGPAEDRKHVSSTLFTLDSAIHVQFARLAVHEDGSLVGCVFLFWIRNNKA